MNRCCITGRLVRDVDYKQNGESSVAKFTVAVDRNFKNAQGQYEADFISCVAFKNRAEFVSKYFSKGKRIEVAGRLQTGSYTNKEGQKVYTCDLIADEIGFGESNNSSNTGNQPAQNEQSAMVNDGFTEIPDDMAELPFN